MKEVMPERREASAIKQAWDRINEQAAQIRSMAALLDRVQHRSGGDGGCMDGCIACRWEKLKSNA